MCSAVCAYSRGTRNFGRINVGSLEEMGLQFGVEKLWNHRWGSISLKLVVKVRIYGNKINKIVPKSKRREGSLYIGWRST